MNSLLRAVVYFLFLFTILRDCHGDHILFYTGGLDPAHCRFMRDLAGHMERGMNHTVSFLVNSAYEDLALHVKTKPTKNEIVFRSPFTYDDIAWMYTVMASWNTHGESRPSHSNDEMACHGNAEEICKLTPRELTISNVNLANCHGLLEDEKTLVQLRRTKFDFYVADPSDLCSVVLAQYLNISYAFAVPTPIINGVYDAWTQLPSPSAYVPHFRTGFDDDMTYPQRIVNTLASTFISPFSERRFRRAHEDLKNRFKIKPEQDLKDAMLWTEIWLFNVHFTLDFPRPLMPSVVPVGGLVTKEAKTLSKKWRDVMDNSSTHGVVLVSFGSLLNLTLLPDVAEVVATALARIPQTVVWKYSGVPPRGLGSNTVLVDNFPQNDLLGHRKVRAFVTHGESVSIHEAIYHEKSIVVIPFYLDQWLNSKVVVSRGIGRRVLPNELTEQKLFAALLTAMTDPKITSNMKELSFAFRDNFRHPLESAGLWLNHVMKFRGDHLRPIVHELYTYQYYLIDVGLFLLTILLLPLVLMYLLIRCLCRCVLRIPQKLMGSNLKKQKNE